MTRTWSGTAWSERIDRALNDLHVPSRPIVEFSANGADGRVERHVFLQGLNSPIGMALIGNDLYVADTDALLRFPYKTGDTEIRAQSMQVATLPGGTIL